MTKLDWPYTWFGFWKEFGGVYRDCPSIDDFKDCMAWDVNEREKVAKYFENAKVIVTTSRLNFPCVITGKRFSGSLSYRTDGDWMWQDDLAYYVKEHSICIPHNMLQVIRRNGYQPPALEDWQIEDLDWPPFFG